MHVCGSDLAASPKFATETATRLRTYLYQAYLRNSPLSATLTAAPVFFCFSFFLSCSPSFSLNQNSQGSPPLFAPPLATRFPPRRLSSLLHPVLIQDVPVWVVRMEFPRPWRVIGAAGTLVFASPCVAIVSVG